MYTAAPTLGTAKYSEINSDREKRIPAYEVLSSGSACATTQESGGSMRFFYPIITVVVLLLTACNGVKSVTPEMIPANILVETSKYTGVIITENGFSEFRYLFDSASTSYWEPSIDDISNVEKCIREFLDSAQLNPKLDTYQKQSAVFILDNLEKYRRQYVGFVVDGEKRIWCNLFYDADDSFYDWQHIPVDLDDGGNRYWQIEYSLPRDECLHFVVHGVS